MCKCCDLLQSASTLLSDLEGTAGQFVRTASPVAAVGITSTSRVVRACRTTVKICSRSKRPAPRCRNVAHKPPNHATPRPRRTRKPPSAKFQFLTRRATRSELNRTAGCRIYGRNRQPAGRLSALCCTLQVLSVLLHLAGTVGSRCSAFELLRYPISVLRDWFRRIGMKPHGGLGQRPPISRCCAAHFRSVFILLTINALAVARDLIWSPKRPDPRDLLFSGYRCFSPGVQQSGLAVNHWVPLCAKN